MRPRLLATLLLPLLLPAQPAARVAEVTRTRGFAALWDFTKRTPDGRFDAHKARRERADLSLDPVNYVRGYWNAGRPATLDDFPLIPEGPFGSAVTFRAEPDPDFRPLLLVPRARLHNSSIDIKGRGQSVTLIVWLRRESGNHAAAGIWHEGTDLKDYQGPTPALVQRGMRQYALFAGLAANPGASAAHVSDNGASTFGDRYARHLSVTPEIIPAGQWAAAAFVFDNRANTVTSYLNGIATENWIEDPGKHPFYQHAARAFERGEYRPPRQFVRLDAGGRLAALRVNPYWFPHDLYSPASQEEGGPFTIGRVIHQGRSNGFIGAIGGVAVFNRALPPKELRRLAFQDQ
jgi:hypothetical protein